MKILTLITGVILVNCCYGQSDTISSKKQKGFLFLSKLHHIYDWPNENELRIGFHDYFFSSDNFDKHYFLDSNKIVSLKNGVRVEFFPNRNQIKKHALSFECQPNICYEYSTFYLIPVVLDYKVYDDNWPPACRNDFFEIKVINGSEVRFYHQQKAIIPVKLEVIK